MKDGNVISIEERGSFADPLTELLREGAGRLIKAAVEAELEGFMEQFRSEKLEDGRPRVVRNGYLPERKMQTGIGAVSVRI
ncbi:MAG: IS256 family transposase, partial [Pyrinomonadaceae bacterium]